jgi:uncharacterized protein with von Willebrand factor type A (vWA) domain
MLPDDFPNSPQEEELERMINEEDRKIEGETEEKMQREDVDKICKFVREPHDFVHIWDYQKYELDEIMRKEEGLKTYSDCIAYLIRRYKIAEEFNDENTPRD